MTSAAMFSGKVLIIAEIAETLKRLTKLLEEENHTVLAIQGLSAAQNYFMETASQTEALPMDVLLIEENSPDLSSKNSPQPSEAMQLAQRLRFEQPELQIVMISQHENTAAILVALRAGVVDYLIEPLHPEKIKQSVRRALELSSILTLNNELKEQNRFTEALKAITSCQDIATLNRIAPELFASLLDTPSAALYLVNKESNEEVHFTPASACGVPRRHHAEGAKFLNWFYKKRWRRFNHVNVLRGNYPPFTVRELFGRNILMIPLRHREGLSGVMIVSRDQRLQGFRRRERSLATNLATHLARTYAILSYYQNSTEKVFIDQLTGLYNQRYLNYYGEHEFNMSRRRQESVTLLMVNVISFREVNEKHGHLAGAEFLSQIAKILKKAFRDTDIVIRLDGDIFLAMLRGSGKSSAGMIEQRIHKLIQGCLIRLKEGVELKPQITSSIGIYPDDGNNLQTILEKGLSQLKSRHHAQPSK